MQPTCAPGFSRPSKQADRTSVGCGCSRRQTSGAAGTCGAWCQVQAQTPSPRGSNREVVPHHVERIPRVRSASYLHRVRAPGAVALDGDAGVKPAEGRKLVTQGDFFAVGAATAFRGHNRKTPVPCGVFVCCVKMSARAAVEKRLRLRYFSLRVCDVDVARRAPERRPSAGSVYSRPLIPRVRLAVLLRIGWLRGKKNPWCRATAPGH